MGSEQYAAQPTPPIFSRSPLRPVPSLLDNLACQSPLGKGAASELRVTGLCPERWKPPDRRVKHLKKSGGASALDDSSILHGSPRDLDCLGLAFTDTNPDLRKAQLSSVDAHERREAMPIVGTAPAMAEDTAGVELASEAERPPPPSLTRWCPGRKTRPGVDVKWRLKRCQPRAN